MDTEVLPKNLCIFRSKSGALPFAEWFENLKDLRAKQKIISRLARVRAGNLGLVETVGKGVHELKIDFGPGYRVYFGQHRLEIIILLCGGDKGSQNADIKKAKAYWEEYKQEKNYANY